MSTLSDGYVTLLVAHVVLGLALGGRVIYIRIRDQVALGDGHNRKLQRAIRAHGNFAEWAPLALLTLGVADLRGASPTAILGVGGVLLLGRVMHGFGLNRRSGPGIGRTGGMALTLMALVAAAGLALTT
ncbi:MAG: MAPEG family protein [Alphaproteobacteria bacterium]|nr:MAPEG family protein [Alphaproteobacteria bacterium]